MLFGTEHRARLKYPVKHAHHHLLVKLRALGQHCRMMEIIQTEQVGTALCSLGSNLRRMNLCKALAVQEIPESPHNTFLNPELGPLPDVP